MFNLFGTNKSNLDIDTYKYRVLIVLMKITINFILNNPFKQLSVLTQLFFVVK